MAHTPSLNKLTLRAKKSLRHAEKISRTCNDQSIKPIHLLHAIYTQNNSVGHVLLKNMGYTDELFTLSNASKASKNSDAKGAPKTSTSKHSAQDARPLSSQLKKVITQAYAHAQALHYPYVGTEHFVYALLASQDRTVQKIVRQLTTATKKKKHSQSANHQKGASDSFMHVARMVDFNDVTMSQHQDHSATPYLDEFCTPLIDSGIPESRQIRIVGRDDEVQRLIHVLGRKNKNNPLLLGEPGVGKTALVTHLAQRIAAGDVPQYLAHMHLLSLDLAGLVAGTSFRGEFEERINNVITEAVAAQNVILFIDELHTITGTGNASGGLDAANILKPALARGALRIIGATTLTEYKRYIEKDPALARRFQGVTVKEPTATEATRMLWKTREHYEKFHNVTLTKDIVRDAVDLSVRYIGDKFLPDKALDIIDETAARVRSKTPPAQKDTMHVLEQKLKDVILQKAALVKDELYDDATALREKEATIARSLVSERKKQRKDTINTAQTLTHDDLYETVALMTNIPQEKITQDPSTNIRNTEKILNKHIIGQKHAARTVSGALLRSFSGLSAPNRPLGSFLFLGPTGVGKTLSARVIAEEVFGSKDTLIRIDMSEFMERHNVAKLIGAPAGYVGHGESTTLLERVRTAPHAIVLFDEIEKAHPDVAHILLQILEDGVITDAEGRTIDFSQAVIILTSNIGTTEFTTAAHVGFRGGISKLRGQDEFNALKDTVIEKLRKQLKPELLNRIDHIITFNALGARDITQIVRNEIGILKNRLKREKAITFTVSPAVVAHVGSASLSFADGARAVRKNIQEMIETPLATYLLDHKNTSRVRMDIKSGALVITTPSRKNKPSLP